MGIFTPTPRFDRWKGWSRCAVLLPGYQNEAGQWKYTEFYMSIKDYHELDSIVLRIIPVVTAQAGNVAIPARSPRALLCPNRAGAQLAILHFFATKPLCEVYAEGKPQADKTLCVPYIQTPC